MTEIARIAAGATAGAVVGYFIGHLQMCSGERCAAKANLVYFAVAGAVFGAAVAKYFSPVTN